MSSTEARDCSLVPPPPPPPPPSQPAQRQKGVPSSTEKDASKQNLLQMIEDACFQSRGILYQSDEPYSIISLYHHCDSVLQSGPTCGLVALMMCLKLVKADLQTDLSTVLLQAQSFGYTKFGEMFNVENMCKFINDAFFVKAECRQWLECSQLEIIEHLCLGQPILLPYDADANYEPCLKGGKRAHWAAVTGFVLSLQGDYTTECLKNLDFSCCTVVALPDNHSLVHIDGSDSKKATSTFQLFKSFLPKSQLYVYARQGKSKRIQIWNFNQLCTSNRNLSQVSSKILDDPERVRMVYPENGDLTMSLANQFILVYK